MGKKRSSKAAAATSKIPENGKSARVPIGRTLKTQDKYLPSDRKKVQELKDRRWVVVIDKNTNEELAVVRLTTEKQPNSSPLPNYRHGNKKETRFKHFVETEDDEGNAIRVDGKKFLQNLKKGIRRFLLAPWRMTASLQWKKTTFHPICLQNPADTIGWMWIKGPMNNRDRDPNMQKCLFESARCTKRRSLLPYTEKHLSIE